MISGEKYDIESFKKEKYPISNNDEPVKSRKSTSIVIPAKAGIQ